jgi:MFS family permease
MTPRRRLGFALLVLFGINFLNFYDRQVVGAIGERIREEWQLSDRQLGSLTTAFVLLYAVVGVPLGRLADVGRRKLILALGVLVWSGFTALSGLAWGFTSLFIFRLGVGAGEASCAPAANSLLGDLFPPHQRARAISLFMLGLPLGLGASFMVSGLVAKATGGWREALFVAAAPGVLFGLLALFLPEPERGATEPGAAAPDRPAGVTIAAILRIPTMRWIIASGALLNLNMYALGAFLTSLLIRYHGLDIDLANRYSSVIYGFGGGFGMLLGGWLGDRVSSGHPGGRLRVAAGALLAAAPLVVLALGQDRGSPAAFATFMLPGCLLHYFYYATVYATIQDVVVPAMRGTAMAVYFFVFYLFTAAGLYMFGWMSDWLAAGAGAAGASAVEARALGLHQAMYAIPVGALFVALVLWRGSRAVAQDRLATAGR